MTTQNKYRILRATRNAGQYEGDQIESLAKAKAIIRADHPGCRLRWRQEGDDICAYVSVEDMDDEDKAVARLSPRGNRMLRAIAAAEGKLPL